MNTVINCNVIFPDGIKRRSVVFSGEKIVEITEQELPSSLEFEGKYLSAGFVDIHTHGGYGADFMDGLSAFDEVLRFHVEHGTTSVVATSVTSPVSSLKRLAKTENG